MSLYSSHGITDKANYCAILPPFPHNKFWRELHREARADMEATGQSSLAGEGKQPLTLPMGYMLVPFPTFL